MNKLIWAITFLVLAVIIGIGIYFYANGNKGENFTIHMSEDGFSPSTLNIKQGQTVKFINDGKEDHWPASNIHPTHLIYPEFDPKRPISPKESWSFTFNKIGIWRMHDHLYPEFTGTITVE